MVRGSWDDLNTFSPTVDPDARAAARREKKAAAEPRTRSKDAAAEQRARETMTVVEHRARENCERATVRRARRKIPSATRQLRGAASERPRGGARSVQCLGATSAPRTTKSIYDPETQRSRCAAAWGWAARAMVGAMPRRDSVRRHPQCRRESTAQRVAPTAEVQRERRKHAVLGFGLGAAKLSHTARVGPSSRRPTTTPNPTPTPSAKRFRTRVVDARIYVSRDGNVRGRGPWRGRRLHVA